MLMYGRKMMIIKIRTTHVYVYVYVRLVLTLYYKILECILESLENSGSLECTP